MVPGSFPVYKESVKEIKAEMEKSVNTENADKQGYTASGGQWLCIDRSGTENLNYDSVLILMLM